jgi:pyridoxamine-phosphate oxidase
LAGGSACPTSRIEFLRFLGIDFGWENQPSGVAALDWANETLHLVALDRLANPSDVLRWVTAQAPESAGIGIDAPLVIPNAAGMRIADRLAHSYYGKYHAGAYPASRARTFWKRTTRLSSSLAKLGFAHGDEWAPKSSGRFQIEVHPHAASVQLFLLDRIVKYKKGRLDERVSELKRLRGLLLERLPTLVPRLAPTELPEIPTSGRELKAVEDKLDAVLAAYIAAYWWYWGRERNQVLGNSRLGYIIVPHRVPDRPTAQNPVLEEAGAAADPMQQFEAWYAQARAGRLKEPGAVALATVSSEGQPSARMVIVREAGARGFVFYTNYRSQKGRELAANPRASLVFYWLELDRQVRVTGQVAKTSSSETEEYFRTRPRGAQLSAWASWQSSVIPDRDVLEQRIQKLASRFADQQIPPPPGWGGYRLRPETIEFWQGRENRLHDRLRYSRKSNGRWRMERLAP